MSLHNVQIEVGGKRGFLMIDDQFEATHRARSLNHIAWFGIWNGLPWGERYWNPEESAQLNAIEDKLFALKKEFGLGQIVFAFRLCTPGTRELFCYCDKAELKAVLDAWRVAFPLYKLDFDERPDVGWSEYEKYLTVAKSMMEKKRQRSPLT